MSDSTSTAAATAPPSTSSPPTPAPSEAPAPAVSVSASKPSNHKAQLKSEHNFRELQSYEAQRRSLYTSKFESSILYWRSFNDLLHASLQETARAHRLVAGMSKAHQEYAKAMQSVYQDTYLDDKGNVVRNEKAQRRLSSVRGSSASEVTSEQSILSKFRQAHAVMADKFGETQDDEQIASEIYDLNVDMQVQVDNMGVVGNAILVELEQIEQQVSQAWNNYFQLMSKDPSVSSAPGALNTPTTTITTEDGEERTLLDVWLVEMQYRIIVNYQKNAWEQSNSELSSLFHTIKEAECQRRIQLREFLIAFCQRQQRLFLSLPTVQKPVLQDLVTRRMDREAVEQELQTNIRQRAAVLIQHVPDKKVATPGEQEDVIDLQSPLHSEFLQHAKVLERRSGMVGGWKTTLAVVTADSYLHLFDLPKTVQVHSNPQIAFEALLPHGVKNWMESLAPADTLVLINSTFAERDDDMLEISERIQTTGASKVFGKSTMRKLLLRTKDVKEWAAVLQKQKEEEAGES